MLDNKQNLEKIAEQDRQVDAIAIQKIVGLTEQEQTKRKIEDIAILEKCIDGALELILLGADITTVKTHLKTREPTQKL